MIKFLRGLLQKLWGMRHYTLIAGTGLLIDNGIYLALIYGANVPVFYAANIGILAGSAFVYYFATQKIFITSGGFSWPKFTWFMIFTIATTIFWAAVIAALVQFGLWPVCAKIAILPVSFYTNFLFLGWLQEGRMRWY